MMFFLKVLAQCCNNTKRFSSGFMATLPVEMVYCAKISINGLIMYVMFYFLRVTSTLHNTIHNIHIKNYICTYKHASMNEESEHTIINRRKFLTFE